MSEKQRCEKFLMANGWKYDPRESRGCGYWLNGTHCAVDMVAGDRIVLLDDTGDFLHLPMNYFALVGALLECHQITVAYKSV